MILNMILEGYFKLWVEANWCFDDLKPVHTRLVLYVINTLFLLILSKIRNFLLHKKWAHKFHVIHCLNFKMKRTLSYLEKSRLFVFTLLCVFVCVCVCACACLLSIAKNRVSNVSFSCLLLFWDYWIIFYNFTLWKSYFTTR